MEEMDGTRIVQSIISVYNCFRWLKLTVSLLQVLLKNSPNMCIIFFFVFCLSLTLHLIFWGKRSYEIEKKEWFSFRSIVFHFFFEKERSLLLNCLKSVVSLFINHTCTFVSFFYLVSFFPRTG